MDANVEHARELAELSMRQEVSEALKTLDALESLLSENPEETEVAVWLAKSLRNLCGRVSGVQAQQFYAGLERLGTMYWESKAVVEEQAKGIILLCAGLDEMSAFVYKARLQGLLTLYPDMADMIEEFQANAD